MAANFEEIIKKVKPFKGTLGGAICELGVGGDGSVNLHEVELDGVATKAAVKSITRQDSLWQK